MQRALSSIVRRSLLQQRTARSVAVAAPSAVALSLQASARRQFSLSSVKLDDKFASSSSSAAEEGSGISFPPLSGEEAPAKPSYSSERPPRPDAKLGLFVGGLEFDVTEDDLKRVFGQFGEVTAANVVMDRDTQRSKRFGFVYFTSESPVQTLLNDSSLLEQLTELGPAPGIEAIARREPRSSSTGTFGGSSGRYGSSSKGEPSDTLFISGFPREMSRAQIEECLAEFYPAAGIVKDLRVPVNRIERIETPDGESTPQNKGYAFVRMGNEEEAQELLSALIQAAKEGFNFPGADRAPSFRFASPQKPGEQQYGGSRGSFGGRNGGERFGARGGQRRTTNNSWINEERSRFQGGRGDEY